MVVFGDRGTRRSRIHLGRDPVKPIRFDTHVYDKDDHTADTPCPPKWHWCRIHWFPFFGTHEPYPFDLNIHSSRAPSGWAHVHVYCGPCAFLPKPECTHDWSRGSRCIRCGATA